MATHGTSNKRQGNPGGWAAPLMIHWATIPERLAPWYVAACVFPYLPWLWAQIFSLESWSFSAVVVLHILIPMLVVLVNWIAGPLLIWRLRGNRRKAVALAFVVGALLPGALIASSYFYQPERPPFISEIG